MKKLSFEQLKKIVANRYRNQEAMPLTEHGKNCVQQAKNITELCIQLDDDPVLPVARILSCLVEMPEKEIIEWEQIADKLLP